MAARIDLAAGDWTASVAPAIGGAVLGLERRGVAILRPTPATAIAAADVRQTACFPLLPYANRIADGRFRFDSADYALRPNFPGSAHPLHGIGWLRAWDVVAFDARSCRLALRHRPAGEAAGDWPFAFDAEQEIALTDAGMSLRLTVTNTGEAAAPVGLGWHPYFPRRPGETLAFAADGVWLNGPDLLPLRRTDTPDWRFSPGRRLGETTIDNDFPGWDGRAILDADAGPRLRLSADPLFGVLRIYTPGGAPYYAVEPVSQRADAINAAGADRDRMSVLAPGERLSGAMAIGLEPGE